MRPLGTSRKPRRGNTGRRKWQGEGSEGNIPDGNVAGADGKAKPWMDTCLMGVEPVVAGAGSEEI